MVLLVQQDQCHQDHLLCLYHQKDLEVQMDLMGLKAQ